MLLTACLHSEASAATRHLATICSLFGILCWLQGSILGSAGSHLVSGCEGGVITVWSPDHATPLHTLREHTADITAMEWCPQASPPQQQQHLLATAAQDHSVRCVFVISIFDYCSGPSCFSLQSVQLVVIPEHRCPHLIRQACC